ncbi:hypothetical protein EJ994_16670 [Maribacter sp. MJ134]|uniref:PepSY-like domain-containing protein n=1 Tax=Maribacter sp. MJ134 TaxID=2496865 RepID=UPI000F82C831|nr:PepSY-like domain-containing protein [Maribacter sp. MJ134]AZQ60359.1 hypothetical protein EJ994_16670 [Maribacter sp. MJ134]
MKLIKRFVLSIMTMSLLLACQSETKGQTPEAVKKSFKSKYPNESDPDWRKDKNGNFESHFKKDGEHYRADFAPNGEWIETESNIKKKELPKAILKVLEADFEDIKIVEIEKVDHATKGTFYDVEIKIDGKKKDLEFSSDGKRIN